MSSQRGHIFIVAAPSGAGKTTLVAALLDRLPELAVCVSHTTRPPREGEIDGEAYHFIDEPAFRQLVEADGFVEHARVFGNHYGTSYGAIEALVAADRDIILEIDWQGAQQIRERIPESISIFIIPPSLEELKSRLTKRGKDAPEVIARRLAESQAEIAHHHDFDYIVVNDDFEQALEDLICICRTARLRGPEQRRRLAPLLKSLLD
ncbi:MAG: guanylate kinase [Pseudomonadota bacterium]